MQLTQLTHCTASTLQTLQPLCNGCAMALPCTSAAIYHCTTCNISIVLLYHHHCATSDNFAAAHTGGIHQYRSLSLTCRKSAAATKAGPQGGVQWLYKMAVQWLCCAHQGRPTGGAHKSSVGRMHQNTPLGRRAVLQHWSRTKPTTLTWKASDTTVSRCPFRAST